MDRSRHEIEVKLPFDSTKRAEASLLRLGAKVTRQRFFEDNLLFDREQDPLKPSGKALRLRRTDSVSSLTFKAPVEGEFRHKVRLEEETIVSEPDAVQRILGALGFAPIYRYQKYRTELRIGELAICLDETPLGCFVELEGPPERIDEVAAELGYSPEDYVCQSYPHLHEKAATERGEEPGDLVFVKQAGSL